MKRLDQVLLAVVLVVAAAVGWFATRDEPTHKEPAAEKDGSYVIGSLPEDGEKPVGACAQGLATALSYDHRSLAEGLDRATALMTDEFGKRFRDTFEKTTTKDATAKKVVTRAVVRGAGLATSDGDAATCLAFLDQVLVRSDGIDKGSEPVKVSQNRVTVTLRQVDGTWLVDDIEPF
ncbi:hypothetical protein [Nocardioides sp. WS12]|uniref:hypothetical protein n=1 Tax=Nocardioides sp. WS12 TaxID=2486272 RepID=UPI0015FBE95A|nr:hypothetical protein [Nocardioides sp. WS12]